MICSAGSGFYIIYFLQQKKETYLDSLTWILPRVSSARDLISSWETKFNSSLKFSFWIAILNLCLLAQNFTFFYFQKVKVFSVSTTMTNLLLLVGQASDSKGLLAQPARGEELQHLLTDWIPLWSHRWGTCCSFIRMQKIPFTCLKQTLLHNLFLFPTSFILFSFIPLPFFTLLPMSLQHFGMSRAMGCLCRSFEMMPWYLSQHWWAKLPAKERGTEGCTPPEARSGLRGLLFWLAAQGAAGRSMHRGHSYPHLPWFDLLLFSSVSFLHALCCCPHCSLQNWPQMKL